MPPQSDPSDSEPNLTPGTTKSDIIGFLYHNDEDRFSPQEISDELGVSYDKAILVLKQLHNNNFIDKTADGCFHACPTREDLFRYAAALDGLERMFATHSGSE